MANSALNGIVDLTLTERFIQGNKPTLISPCYDSLLNKLNEVIVLEKQYALGSSFDNSLIDEMTTKLGNVLEELAEFKYAVWSNPNEGNVRASRVYSGINQIYQYYAQIIGLEESKKAKAKNTKPIGLLRRIVNWRLNQIS